MRLSDEGTAHGLRLPRYGESDVPLPLPYSLDDAEGMVEASDEVVAGEVVVAPLVVEATELTCTGVSTPTLALALWPPASVVVLLTGESVVDCEIPEARPFPLALVPERAPVVDVPVIPVVPGVVPPVVVDAPVGPALPVVPVLPVVPAVPAVPVAGAPVVVVPVLDADEDPAPDAAPDESEPVLELGGSVAAAFGLELV